MPSRNDIAMTGRLLAGVLTVVLAVWLVLLWRGLHHSLWFDDSYMFYRYAFNVRHGLGVSWNYDAVHTYGETALLWGLVVLVLSYLPMNASQVLILGSWLCSVGAVVAMAWAVRSATEPEQRGLGGWQVMALLAVPLVLVDNFRYHARSGMDAMLGMALCAVFLAAALLWARGRIAPEIASLAGLLLYATRPEGAMIVVLVPVLMVLVWRKGSLAGLARLLGTFVACIAVELLLCKLYFHTALPLSFYMKSRNGYEGYMRYWHPTFQLGEFLAGCALYLAVMVWAARRQDARMLSVFVVPVLCMAVYLNSVLQIMNDCSRYYLPYLPLLLVPALVVLDRRMGDGMGWWKLHATHGLALRLVGLACLVLLCWPGLRRRVALAVDRTIERKQYAYDPVVLQTAASGKLPVMQEIWKTVPDQIFATLPAGATVASSEVGYLGARLQSVNVIDLEGLNDTQIALQGFRMPDLLERRPDAIWMPHPDYTWQRGVMMTDPEFLRQYELYRDAALSGIAIRRDSPYRAQLEANLQKSYPGVVIADSLVTAASWSGKKHVVVDTE
jgi:hypothetical protein